MYNSKDECKPLETTLGINMEAACWICKITQDEHRILNPPKAKREMDEEHRVQ